MMDFLNLRMIKKLSLKDGGEKDVLYFEFVWFRILRFCFLIYFSMEGKREIFIWFCISFYWFLILVSFLFVFYMVF